MNKPSAENDPDHESERPSKSQRKRDSHALQDLGEQLATLSSDTLRALNVPDDLIDAILEYQRTRSHEGRRRQMQLVGKLMRNLDEPTRQRLRAGFDVATRQSRDETARLHELERWRERLLDDDEAVTQWIAAHPGTDAQRLRALLRTARKERDSAVPPRAFREVFQLLRADSMPATAPNESEGIRE